jgi:hypothetical protein
MEEEQQTTRHQLRKKHKSEPPNLSTVDSRSRRIQPACSPEAVFKSRGCHASPLFTPKLYLHNLLFCPISGLGLLFPTRLSDFVISGNAERLRANSPR